METMLPDTQERARALDVTQSFIVQAPAGSGKTTLLTQRYLRLLALVPEKPEQILAITFTRKAAAEMRQRIFSALQTAHDTIPEENEPLSIRLARTVLERDQREQWHLLKNPQRLWIQTIDAFSADIVARLPMHTTLSSYKEITEDPIWLYHTAIHHFLLQHLKAGSPELKRVLLHLDNRLDFAIRLFTDLLEIRDQWLPFLIHQKNYLPELRACLEKSLYNISLDALKRVKKTFPHFLEKDLLTLLSFAEKNGFNPNIENNELKLYKKLSLLLLTQEKEWRSRVDKKLGFPPQTEAKNTIEKNEYSAMKNLWKDTIESLEKENTFKTALTDLCLLPPHLYNDAQWEMLTALISVLPLLSAHLELIFQKNHTIDFPALTQSALLALGESDSPSDLALALDYKIQHILVDEFQDTSINQFRLLTHLTSGWQPGEGRSLFLVGDPMQSIYRFRQAEVGLFIQARQFGLGDIPLTSLTLKTNFRSQPSLIDWVNQYFPHLFPQEEDIPSGAIRYTPCITTQTALSNDAVHYYAHIEVQAESMRIISLVQTLQSLHPQDTIAILAPTRTSITHLLSTLRANNIAFQGIALESIAQEPIIQDLLIIARVLHHPADRIAWLALLRAPWCALSLKTLHFIVHHTKGDTLLEQLLSLETTIDLEEDELTKLTKIAQLFSSLHQNRERLSLSQQIHHAWNVLQGNRIYPHEHQDRLKRQFLKLIDQWKIHPEPTLSTLEELLNNTYLEHQTVSETKLFILTIHKAKGLEFDHVILSGLAKKPRYAKQRLLTWLERTRNNGEIDPLLAPMKASDETDAPINAYLRREHAHREQLERMRLLYVAVTRAKKTLHLFGLLNLKEDEILAPRAGSLLSAIWSEHQQFFIKNLIITHTMTTAKNVIHPLRQSILLTTTAPTSIILESTHNSPTWDWEAPYTAAIGTVCHQLLQQIAEVGINNWLKNSWENYHPQWRMKLQKYGVLPDKLCAAVDLIELSLKKVLNDPKGVWILSPHPEAHCEYGLSNTEGNWILDRTFIFDHERWIIDYKLVFTSTNLFNAHLREYQASYAQQIKHYGNLFSTLDKRPIRLGLYFPLQSHLLYDHEISLCPRN